jgi:hypothetical protein
MSSGSVGCGLGSVPTRFTDVSIFLRFVSAPITCTVGFSVEWHSRFLCRVALYLLPLLYDFMCSVSLPFTFTVGFSVEWHSRFLCLNGSLPFTFTVGFYVIWLSTVYLYRRDLGTMALYDILCIYCTKGGGIRIFLGFDGPSFASARLPCPRPSPLKEGGANLTEASTSQGTRSSWGVLIAPVFAD